jgi:hypothetical protein
MYEENNTCLFVSEKGQLMLLICPFAVRAYYDLDGIAGGDIVLVTSVLSSIKGELVFQINNQFYYAYHFLLLL